MFQSVESAKIQKVGIVLLEVGFSSDLESLFFYVVEEHFKFRRYGKFTRFFDLSRTSKAVLIYLQPTCDLSFS